MYGTPLAQIASYLALHSSLFGLDGAINYDCILSLTVLHVHVTLLLVGSRCVPINNC